MTGCSWLNESLNNVMFYNGLNTIGGISGMMNQ